MSFHHVFGPSGGLQYHFKALRHNRSLWRPFVSSVSQWLNLDWNPTEDQLVIFGSSAGWTLDQKFINRFKKVIIVEPDPVARFLFRKRFSDALDLAFFPSKYIDNLLPWFADDPKTCELQEILARYPNAAILFSNLLGQIPLLKKNKSPEFEMRSRECFLEALHGRNWASYHDVVSAKNAVLARNHDLLLPKDKKPDLEKIATHYFAHVNEVIDHETLWLSENRKTKLAVWPLSGKAVHIVGFTKS